MLTVSSDMNATLALIPLFLVLGLLGSGRAGSLTAGLAGLAATVTIAGGLALADGGPAALTAVLTRETPIGLWLAWHVVTIIVAGVFFHRSTLTRAVAPAGAGGEPTPRRLWSLCFLLAPFAESVTGFGVGYLIALAALRRLGLGAMPALLLGLYSQTLVPWGALAVGTTVGAALAGLAPGDLGVRSALLQIPIHALYLALYWRLVRQAGVPVPLRQKLDDAAWTALLLALLVVMNLRGAHEIAGAAPCALLLALRFWRDERPDRTRLMDALRVSAPYVALTLVLCATRLIAPLRDLLEPLAAVRPYDFLPAFSPFYAPGFWLLAVAVAVASSTRTPLSRLAAETARAAWRSCAVTLAFVLMAQFFLGSGMAAALAEGLRASIGHWAVLGVPVFAAAGGFLTGSGAASNAMLLPMEIALAHALALDPAWMAAVQNSVTANLSMLSPVRVSMGTAIMGMAAAEAALYRRAWPLALPATVTGLAAVLVMSLQGR
jgi:lactate permease